MPNSYSLRPVHLLLLLLVASVGGGAVSVLLGRLSAPTAAKATAATASLRLPKDGFKITTEAAPAEDLRFTVPEGLNFVTAAQRATPAVVHIKTTYNGYASQYGRQSFSEMFEELFGESAPEGYHDRNMRSSSGSGVVLSADGYIATNYHVVENASTIEVVMQDKRQYEATVVGTDPTTDLAVVKIEAEQLPFVRFGNSDQVRIGQWVLAVGNPFDLTSTVTAGIVSAKGRNINILRSRDGLSIESFIQTDAVVNPGNSGGALVDLNGDLIGINTAIATNTGSYSGYSFAVPASLVQKVVEDLIDFGQVQRALLGVRIVDVNAEMAEEFLLPEVAGVMVAGVSAGSGADDAGLLSGDVILEINEVPVNSVSRLQEVVARYRPGELIDVKLLRDGMEQQVEVELRNVQNSLQPISQTPPAKANAEQLLGVKIKPITPLEKETLGIGGGLRIDEINSGLLKESGIRRGYIITEIDKVAIETEADLLKAVEGKKGGILIEGVYSDGRPAVYGINLR
jgi:Do/DeqQ family serine protease